MNDVLAKLRKLKGRGARELRARSAQTLAAYAERRGFSKQARVPSDAELFSAMAVDQTGGTSLSAQKLLEHFRTRTSPRFFASFDDRGRTVEALRERFGSQMKEAVVEKALRIIGGRFDLLGWRDLSFGQPPDWHLEPVSQRRAPKLHWSRIPYLDADVAGDKKIIWELNRHQYFATLGRAYLHTGDERYTATFASHLESWITENSPKLGINWSSSLEVSFRAISWLWAFHFFKDSKQLTPALFLRALKFLYIHARHLETYLSTYFSPNTHLTGEALGLYYLGTLLPEFRHAARWRERGQNILMGALDFQVRADGVYFEQASYYHRYTADFYTHLLILARLNNRAIEPKLIEKLTALLDHLMYITRPDGTTPLFGDDDGGRLVMLDERAPDDFRSTLATGAALLKRGDYKYVAEDASEETFWLLGCEGLEAFDELPAEKPRDESRAFKDGGYFVMRDGWTKESNYLLVDCGPHGALNCGHAHADALAFDLASAGRTLLVDPGTYTYTGSAEIRDLLRSSTAHNTLTVDNESSSVPDTSPFHWRQIAESRLHDWLSHARFDYFSGSHDGYRRLPSPALHARSILFIKGNYFIMRDRVRTDGAHRYELRFHFSPEAVPRICEEGDGVVVRERAEGKSGLELHTFGGEWAVEDGWVSPCYGQRVAAPVLSLLARAEGAHEFITFMIPHAAAMLSEAVVREHTATGGRLFEVRQKDFCDNLALGDGDLVEGERFHSDFVWSWVRFSNEDARVEEVLLIGGSKFFLNGRAVFESKTRASYVLARRVEGELLLERDGHEERVPLEDGETESNVYSF